MNIIPDAKATRFEQLEPGDLFIHLPGTSATYAIKTEKPSNGDKNNLVLLGPTFPEHINEAFLLPWQASAAISVGKNYSVILPTEPSAWSINGPNRDAVCLALSGDKLYVCCHGGPSPQHFFQCFVEMETGAIVEGRLPGSALFTNRWEIVLPMPKSPPRTVIKYPLGTRK